MSINIQKSHVRSNTIIPQTTSTSYNQQYQLSSQSTNTNGSSNSTTPQYFLSQPNRSKSCVGRLTCFLNTKPQKDCGACKAPDRFVYFHSSTTQMLYEKYSSSQNYYFTRDVNEILTNSRTHSAIIFQDVNMLDEPDECLKRYYQSSEYPQKIQLLSQYYKFHRDISRLFMLPETNILNNYHDKKRRYDYYKIAQVIEQENQNNPNRPPKGIVGDQPDLHTETDESSVKTEGPGLIGIQLLGDISSYVNHGEHSEMNSQNPENRKFDQRLEVQQDSDQFKKLLNHEILENNERFSGQRYVMNGFQPHQMEQDFKTNEKRKNNCSETIQELNYQLLEIANSSNNFIADLEKNDPIENNENLSQFIKFMQKKEDHFQNNPQKSNNLKPNHQPTPTIQNNLINNGNIINTNNHNLYNGTNNPSSNSIPANAFMKSQNGTTPISDQNNLNNNNNNKIKQPQIQIPFQEINLEFQQQQQQQQSIKSQTGPNQTNNRNRNGFHVNEENPILPYPSTSSLNNQNKSKENKPELKQRQAHSPNNAGPAPPKPAILHTQSNSMNFTPNQVAIASNFINNPYTTNFTPVTVNTNIGSHHQQSEQQSQNQNYGTYPLNFGAPNNTQRKPQTQVKQSQNIPIQTPININTNLNSNHLSAPINNNNNAVHQQQSPNMAPLRLDEMDYSGQIEQFKVVQLAPKTTTNHTRNNSNQLNQVDYDAPLTARNHQDNINMISNTNRNCMSNNSSAYAKNSQLNMDVPLFSSTNVNLNAVPPNSSQSNSFQDIYSSTELLVQRVENNPSNGSQNLAGKKDSVKSGTLHQKKNSDFVFSYNSTIQSPRDGKNEPRPIYSNSTNVSLNNYNSTNPSFNPNATSQGLSLSQNNSSSNNNNNNGNFKRNSQISSNIQSLLQNNMISTPRSSNGNVNQKPNFQSGSLLNGNQNGYAQSPQTRDQYQNLMPQTNYQILSESNSPVGQGILIHNNANTNNNNNFFMQESLQINNFFNSQSQNTLLMETGQYMNSARNYGSNSQNDSNVQNQLQINLKLNTKEVQNDPYVQLNSNQSSPRHLVSPGNSPRPPSSSYTENMQLKSGSLRQNFASGHNSKPEDESQYSQYNNNNSQGSLSQRNFVFSPTNSQLQNSEFNQSKSSKPTLTKEEHINQLLLNNAKIAKQNYNINNNNIKQSGKVNNGHDNSKQGNLRDQMFRQSNTIWNPNEMASTSPNSFRNNYSSANQTQDQLNNLSGGREQLYNGGNTMNFISQNGVPHSSREHPASVFMNSIPVSRNNSSENQIKKDVKLKSGEFLQEQLVNLNNQISSNFSDRFLQDADEEDPSRQNYIERNLQYFNTLLIQSQDADINNKIAQSEDLKQIYNNLKNSIKPNLKNSSPNKIVLDDNYMKNNNNNNNHNNNYNEFEFMQKNKNFAMATTIYQSAQENSLSSQNFKYSSGGGVSTPTTSSINNLQKPNSQSSSQSQNQGGLGGGSSSDLKLSLNSPTNSSQIKLNSQLMKKFTLNSPNASSTSVKDSISSPSLKSKLMSNILNNQKPKKLNESGSHNNQTNSSTNQNNNSENNSQIHNQQPINLAANQNFYNSTTGNKAESYLNNFRQDGSNVGTLNGNTIQNQMLFQHADQVTTNTGYLSQRPSTTTTILSNSQNLGKANSPQNPKDIQFEIPIKKPLISNKQFASNI